MKNAILAIDQGTTGTTALLLDADVNVVAQHNCEFPNHYPRPGWVEHDTAEIWDSVQRAVSGVIAKAPNITIVAIGITNQRETSLFWDRESGEPIHKALVWQDRRTADTCALLKAKGLESLVTEKTGLVLDPYFSGTKAKWLLDNVPKARQRAAGGELLFGTIDTWLAWKLTGAHVTDPSNASRTLLYNINTMDWDPEMLEMLEIPANVLPEVVDNNAVVGHTRGLGFLPDGIPVSGMAGDQQSALFGQACFESGSAKCTYGTGAFVLMNTGSERRRSSNGLLSTVGWRINGDTVYALEGSAFIAGAAVQWLRDGLGIISSASEVETLAATVDDTCGTSFVPALAGLGAPHWRPEARGIFCGITGGVTKAHLARAVLEGVSMQIVDILDAMSDDSGVALDNLKVDGGMSRNDLLMQYQSDVLGVTCVRPQILETTALGAAFLAGLGIGFWESFDAVKAAWRRSAAYEPQMNKEERARALSAWHNAVAKA